MNTQTKAQNGFTLIEMLTAMAVAAILLGSAGPNFFEFIGSSRSATEYRSLLSSLQLARSEAITRGTSVTVSAKTGANWHEGFQVWADEDGDGTFDAGEEIIDVAGFNSASTLIEAGDTTSFTYTAEGFLNAVTGTSFVISYRTSDNCKWDRDINLVYTGHVSARERACTE